MFSIDHRSSVPIHEQVKSGLRDLVFKGLLKPGEEVPSVRSFAETLLVSPGVIARAYRELAKEGFLEARPGQKNCISRQAQAQAAKNLGDILQELVKSIQSSRQAGLQWEEIESVIQFLKSGTEQPQAMMVPSILKKLYYDSSATPTGRPICPYCRETVPSHESSVSCMLCRTLHHEECWDEAAHCSVFGCKGKVKIHL